MTRERQHPDRVGLTTGNWIAILTLVLGSAGSVIYVTTSAAYTLSRDFSQFQMEMKTDVSTIKATMDHHGEQIKRVENRLDRMNP